jgi:flagellar hook protein FlgE
VQIELNNTGVDTPLVIDVQFDRVTAFANQVSQLNLVEQDGYEEGTLSDFSIGADGLVTGIFSNGQTRTLAQIALTRFANPNGLDAIGGNLFRQAANSGEPITGVAGLGGRGVIRSGFLEESNVDFSKQFTDMIVSQRAFQANARTITTADRLLEELVNVV